MADLHRLRFVDVADVYKAGRLAGRLERAEDAGTAFTYDPAYLNAGHPPVALTLPLTGEPVTASSGGVPPFFAGLLPEGHRLTVLKDAIKTSLDDELSLLLAVGADAPGDVQVVPTGDAPVEPEALVDSAKPQELDFTALAEAVDLHALPGVQDKASASMLTAPLATQGNRLILKLNPPRHPHLVENEAIHLAAAKKLKIPIAKATVVVDRHGRPGLLVERFDRAHDGEDWVRLPMEDAAQIMGLSPAAKYNVSSEDVVKALTTVCKAPAVAVRNLYLQFVFAWLTGNGDLHAKNVSVLGGRHGGFVIAPVYDVPCTLLYGDDTQALPVDGKMKNIRARHWAAFAQAIGLPERAALAANALALRAATTADLKTLPFKGSPLTHTERELRYRRGQLEV